MPEGGNIPPAKPVTSKPVKPTKPTKPTGKRHA